MSFTKQIVPSESIVSTSEWLVKEALWKNLYSEVGGEKQLSALTIKAVYVTGTIFQICESVTVLLDNRDFARQVSFIPALGIYISAIEILGRCVKGETAHWHSTLQSGLKWICNPLYPSYTNVAKNTNVVITENRTYTIEDIEALRNFSAHGQAVSQLYVLDYQLIEKLHERLTEGLIQFWEQLTLSHALCDNLAAANIVPFRGSPLLTFEYKLTRNGATIKDVFEQLKPRLRI